MTLWPKPAAIPTAAESAPPVTEPVVHRWQQVAAPEHFVFYCWLPRALAAHMDASHSHLVNFLDGPASVHARHAAPEQ